MTFGENQYASASHPSECTLTAVYALTEMWRRVHFAIATQRKPTVNVPATDKSAFPNTIEQLPAARGASRGNVCLNICDGD